MKGPSFPNRFQCLPPLLHHRRPGLHIDPKRIELRLQITSRECDDHSSAG